MRLADAIRWFFALPDPAVDRSAMTRRQLIKDAHQRKLRTPFGRAMIRYSMLRESIPHRVRALVEILWRATAGRWLWIKEANFAETEIATMRYVANHTDIPVPRVWFSFKWGNREYIVMDRIAGITLFDALCEGYLQDSDKQDRIAGQLARHMVQLRSLAPPPNSSISSVLGGPVRCPRLLQDPLYGPTAPAPPMGPFSEATMNLQLRHLRDLETCDPVVVAAHSTAHPFVLTHNDFVPRNIMVDHAIGKVVAIIDWEYAGWFPAHWEVCMMMNWEQQSVGLGWRGWVSKILPRHELTYAQELEADASLLKALWVPKRHA